LIHTFTPSPWIKFGTAIASVVCSAIALTYFHSGGTKLRLLVPLAAIAAFSFMGLVDALTTRVVLSEESLTIRRNFRSVTYARESIREASWEGGAPVSILVESRGWVHLPPVGPGPSLVRAIDAWLKRTMVA